MTQKFVIRQTDSAHHLVWYLQHPSPDPRGTIWTTRLESAYFFEWRSDSEKCLRELGDPSLRILPVNVTAEIIPE